MDLTARFQRADQDDQGEEPVARRCELDGYDTPLPLVPGRENQNKYCCPNTGRRPTKPGAQPNTAEPTEAG